MRTYMTNGIVLVLLALTGSVSAQEVVWTSATPKSDATPALPIVSLGQPRRLTPVAEEAPAERGVSNIGIDLPRVVRGQAPPPPAPAFPGSAGPAPFTPVPTGGNPYSAGQVNNDADLGGFWSRCWDKTKRCWEDVTGSAAGAFRTTPGHRPFASDREFEFFTSPVSNPFYFEDPRALTEIRPIFIWQHTPSANPIWNGGNNYNFAVRGSLAVTENISIVVNKLGWTWINPSNGTVDIDTANGFSEIHLGPKVTFFRSRDTKTVMAAGLTFEIPSGSSQVLQDTGSLSLTPYFSMAQNFGRSNYGSFNFMNTTGYEFRTDSQRTDAFFASFHLDYNIADAGRIFPLVELNWRYYTRSGGARALNFEGNDLANFGSTTVSNFSDLNLALGSRFRINNNIDFGLAAEFNVLGNSGGRHLDQFRLTTDLIFRY